MHQLSIKDDLLRHQIFILRFAESNAQQMLRVVRQGISTAINSLTSNPGGLSKQKLKELEASVLRQLVEIKGQQLEELKDLATYEVEFILRSLANNNIVENPKAPSLEEIQKNIEKSKVGLVADENRKNIKQVYNAFAKQKTKEIVRVVKDVDLEDEEPEAKVEKAKNNYALLAAGLFAAQALSVSSTTAVQAASEARQAVYEENKIPLVEWVSTLDGDVCPDCEALHGKQWPVDEAEIPPEHWNCRCVLEPVNE